MRANRVRLVLSLTAASCVIILSGSAAAQADRYELGRRLRTFEERWDQTSTPEDRQRAAQALNASVSDFFRMEFGEAARAMTRAFRLLEGSEERSEAIRWADSRAMTPATRLVERGRPKLEATIGAVYSVDVEPPVGAMGRISVVIEGENAARTLRETSLGKGSEQVQVPTADLPEGDHLLILDVVVAGRELARSQSVLSVVDRLTDRLDAARETIDAWSGGEVSFTTDTETARQHVQTLTNLANGGASETDIEAARLMRVLEALLVSLDEGQPFHGPDRPGSFRMTLTSPEGRLIPARVFVPEEFSDGKAVPLVVALHGMGGSENLFFDGYGRGAIVEHCRERGWLLISPRRGPVGSGPVDEVVDAMASLYPVDPSRVFLVGHSMGAAQAIDALVREPNRYAGAVALGGGGAVADVPGLTRIPVLIGIGDQDFMIRSARKLQNDLEAIGSEQVEYREYPHIEHLVIVQVALPDTFEFFDRIVSVPRGDD
ncbi:hypothetical protein [Tautonia rosea]|uniref:hypothetical protein n=1 Tax=Tautonia rosea TaxID=2728037 RepID=UPI0014751DC5|nr:hypothetical protein [Tautonia rosea]